MFVEQMRQVSGWIVSTAASRTVQGIEGYVATLQSIHILAIAAVLASSVLINLRVLGLIYTSVPVVVIGRRLATAVWCGVATLVLTGLALLLAEPERSLESQVFQMKMGLLVVACVLSWLQLGTVRSQAANWDAQARVPASVRVPAMLLLVVWPLIIFAGRWIAYAQY
jgi:hypothetical protein